jgi:hypothetical protein
MNISNKFIVKKIDTFKYNQDYLYLTSKYKSNTRFFSTNPFKTDYEKINSSNKPLAFSFKTGSDVEKYIKINISKKSLSFISEAHAPKFIPLSVYVNFVNRFWL